MCVYNTVSGWAWSVFRMRASHFCWWRVGLVDPIPGICRYFAICMFVSTRFDALESLHGAIPVRASASASCLSPCARLGARLPPRLAGCAVQYTRGVHGGIDNFPGHHLIVYTMTASRMLKVSKLTSLEQDRDDDELVLALSLVLLRRHLY